ncbi:NAD(P)H-hydrate dehydratase [Vibrio mediterranei]|uniref:Bifunctional NAD(P)H-hydrate repair enzyme n=1 Tax=Vibrio mediterranei TaxID=689 RepID=A0ABX5D865_9VIBR|nr:NAD(P)H-hydrate dehydratase [Vibrio mediterranei]MCG9662647.1 NAD(P)H-hydrate dehydratase [Vibrio mediterranei]PCD86093.1 bifunctional ADP-dependent NAD(P)H-hydrate dehydratase/NAD(P)H-hydrate epimerase [Vibrio mediterranei]PRQ64856.1 bifunctional ADP-dependent NAD(P)H-hydrate dehydratase/NAD(P)H-hydrate epimerase [Vibrio mediterranei]PTC05234.1 NAD(P)H-hydrate dehydratase [Vibrio mediterranei]
MISSNQNITSLPESLFTSQQVREGEKIVAQQLRIEMYTLMQQAGASVFELIQTYYSETRKLLVCCGKGNNGGDGYIVAKLSLSAGYAVTVWQIGDSSALKGDALRAKDEFLAAGGVIDSPENVVADDIDVIIDALLGTGISGEVRPFYSHVFDRLNQSSKPIISIDTPSGLDTDTGVVLGNAIKADRTLTFIGVKQGLVTGRARAFTGHLHFAGLGVDREFAQQNKANVVLTNNHWMSYLPQRAKDSHKGTHGKLLVVGANDGMSGAAYLASAACLRAGGGLCAVLTHEASVTPIRTLLPEAMIDACTTQSLTERVNWSSAIAIGVGLGRTAWSARVFDQTLKLAMSLDLPVVIDADGLYWLNQIQSDTAVLKNHIITPHPGEAAQLLNCRISDIEKDRFQAIRALQKTYGGVVVLKGAGTLIYDGQSMVVCHAGNPGMSSGGMGDLLTGTILALLGQGKNNMQSATLGTLIHSLAADQESKEHGEVGMLASDLLPQIRLVRNHDNYVSS